MEEENKELKQEPVQEANQEVVQEDPFANAPNVGEEGNGEQKFTPMGQVNEPKPKKKKSKVGVLIFIVLLLLAIVGGLAYYYFNVYTNPQVIYQQAIKTGFNSLTETSEEFTTLKAKTKLDVNIDLDESYMEEGVEELLDLINNIDATVEIQMDTNEKKALFKLESNYENEELLNANMLFDTKNEETYVELNQFFDNVLELGTEEVDLSDLKGAFETEETIFKDEAARKKAVGILNDEFVKIIKDEYCSNEKEKITVNGKEVNADKYVLTMTYVQMGEELKTVFENLKNNEEFLNCFEAKDDLKGTLEDAIDEIEYAVEGYEEATLSIKLYKTGLKQELVRVDAEVEADGEKIVVKVEKAQDSYKFELTALGETVLSGTIKTEKLDKDMTKLNLTFDVEDVVEVALDMEYGYVINEAIDTINTEDAKSLDEFTESEQQKVLENLQESKLYELIEDFSELSNNAGLGEIDTELPDEDYSDMEELPDDDSVIEEMPNDDTTMNNIEKNISTNAALNSAGRLVVFASNNNTVAVDMDIEVEFYDENGILVGSGDDYLTAVGAENEIVLEIWETPANFATYKIYVDAEKTTETEYFEQIEMTHTDNGENIVVQVKNNSDDIIEFITVSVVFYNEGNVVGFDSGTTSDVKSGRSGNFNIYYPFDAEYNDVEFDDYEVYVTEAYSYSY